LFNASLVMRFGMRRLSGYAMSGVCLLSFPFWIVAALQAGQPPLYLLMAYLLPLFFCFGILFGNLNALAMEPLGHIAGLGSALIGSISTLMSVVFGVVIAGAYDQTVIPLVAGFAVLGLAGVITMGWTEAKLRRTR
jgi:DHA1 family bicyclomycin/chloramphenicol resistance-like MFS transporter